MNVFDEKYFEDGVRNHISAYENYRWMPERTIREASSICREISFNNVLDFGCAKGFMVYAMRLLGKEAHGVDISDYAVSNCQPQVKDYLSVIKSTEEIKGGWDLIIAKDVLEHINKEDLPKVLADFRARTKQIIIAVPLGDGRRFRIREYEMDITHVVREPEEFWLTALAEAGFKIKYFDYTLGHLKTNWTEDHPYGNAFIIGE
jgi:SAM-dependent methyltransferase